MAKDEVAVKILNAGNTEGILTKEKKRGFQRSYLPKVKTAFAVPRFAKGALQPK